LGCLPRSLLKCVEAKEEALKMEALHLNLQRLKYTKYMSCSLSEDSNCFILKE